MELVRVGVCLSGRVAVCSRCAYVCVCEGLLGLLVLLQRMGSNPTIRAALLAFLLGIFPPIKVRHYYRDGCKKKA